MKGSGCCLPEAGKHGGQSRAFVQSTASVLLTDEQRCALLLLLARHLPYSLSVRASGRLVERQGKRTPCTAMSNEGKVSLSN